MSVIDYKIMYPNNPHFVFHDSRGIEAGAESDSVGRKVGKGKSECDSFRFALDYYTAFVHRGQWSVLSKRLMVTLYYSVGSTEIGGLVPAGEEVCASP
jgi:hypothetical protein